MKSKWMLMTVITGALLAPLTGTAQVAAPKTADSPKATTAKAGAVTTAPTDAEIADARSKGLVWANTNTKVYHKDGAFFGKTKKGKFMTEDEATKAGYKAAKEPVAKKAKAAATK